MFFLSVGPCNFSFRSQISLASSFKKTEVKLELLTDIDMLLMVEKGIRGGICYSVYRYINDSNKYIDYDKNKEPSYLKYWGVNNLYNCTISQRLPVNDFKWVGDISESDESFIESYNEETFTMIYHFYLKEWKLNMLFT